MAGKRCQQIDNCSGLLKAGAHCSLLCLSSSSIYMILFDYTWEAAVIWVSLMVSSFTVAAVFIVYIYAVVRTAWLCVWPRGNLLYLLIHVCLSHCSFFTHTLLWGGYLSMSVTWPDLSTKLTLITSSNVNVCFGWLIFKCLFLVFAEMFHHPQTVTFVCNWLYITELLSEKYFCVFSI